MPQSLDCLGVNILRPRSRIGFIEVCQTKWSRSTFWWGCQVDPVTYLIRRRYLVLIQRLSLCLIPKRLIYVPIIYTKGAKEICQCRQDRATERNDLSSSQSVNPKASVKPMASGNITSQTRLMAMRNARVGSFDVESCSVVEISPKDSISVRLFSTAVNRYFKIQICE